MRQMHSDADHVKLHQHITSDGLFMVNYCELKITQDWV